MGNLKFRAWDTEKKEIAKVLRMSFDEDDITLMDSDCRIWTTVRNYIAIPMQYTGLKDKNGTEIYEGDILSFFCCDNVCVQFEHGSFIARISKNYFTNLSMILDNYDCEVVGNIYENPELFLKLADSEPLINKASESQKSL